MRGLKTLLGATLILGAASLSNQAAANPFVAYQDIPPFSSEGRAFGGTHYLGQCQLGFFNPFRYYCF